MTDLVKMTATEVVGLLKDGKVSPEELLDASEARIKETDGAINALPTLCFDRARAHAARLKTENLTDRPDPHLHGLPIAIKDLTPVKDVRFTSGSPIFADRIADFSDVMVERLEERGGIVIGKSNTPEFGAGGQTFNEVFGTTTNPWNTERTPGGSSGGAASALATGQVWLAQGSDLGGSLRTPASFTGVVGLRPSPKRVAHGPLRLPFSTYPVEGPMARNVPDTALFLDMMAGSHVLDPSSLPAPETSYVDSLKDIPKFGRIAYSPDLSQCPVDPEVADICAKAAADFERYCNGVEETCPDLHDAEEIFQTLRAQLFIANHAPLLAEHRDKLKPEVIWNVEKGAKLNADDIGAAQRAQGDLYQRIVKFFSEYDFLITPASIVPAFPHKLRYVEEVNGVKFDNYMSWLALPSMLTVTNCPVISIPCGFTKSGLPVGLQIMGPNAREDRVLQAACAFERDHDYASRVPIDPITPA
ncbi:amidase [Sneathiella sp.]|uniref:amidase n=1 Tax=Sneathiella sp. TaxID=1964365 RepID=UPI00262928EB|nr:amidase family protein [Sneathiella sp.]MDF2367696.1 amidase family protein [Sneathiella sp.]